MRSSFKGGIQEIHDEGARREGAAELEQSEVLEDPTLVPWLTVRKVAENYCKISQISNVSENSMKEVTCCEYVGL